jgi:hypothetical protein
MLSASHRDLKNAYVWNYEASKALKGTSISNMLLFYAVECGLKHVYLKRSNLGSTASIRADLQGSHDLLLWATELRISGATLGDTPKFSLLSDSKRLPQKPLAHPPHMAHQAWRYGISILEEDERRLVEWLERLRLY